LWRQMKRGKPAKRLAAKHALVISVLPWVVTLARKYAPNGELHDWISIGNVHVCRNMDKFDPNLGRLTTFVARCLSRLYFRELDQVRKRYRERCVGDLLVLSAPHAVVHPDPDLDRGHFRDDVDAAIAGLPPREGDVVRRRMQGQTLKEIGAHLSVSKERVRQLETRAHLRLRTSLYRYRAVTSFGE